MTKGNNMSIVIRVCDELGKALTKLASDKRWTMIVASEEVCKDPSLLSPYFGELTSKEQTS